MKKIAVIVPVTSVEIEVTCSETIIALSFSTLLLECPMKSLERSALG